MPKSEPIAAPSTAPTPMRGVRIALVVSGLSLLVVGAAVLLNDVAPKNYPGILLWLGGALVLHDGILAPIVFGASLVLRRAGRRIPFAVLLIVQGAVVVAAITTLLVFPELLKQGIGTANPTVLPLNYGAALLGFYGALAVVTTLAVLIYLRVAARRQKLRPSLTQN